MGARDEALTRRLRSLTAIASLALLLVTSIVRAQTDDAPRPTPGALVAPSLLSDTSVAYPEGATGEATVVLTLVVGDDGAVRSAKAADDHPPFSKDAERAALAWRFQPATRDGKPVAARIRVEVVFRPPTPPPTAPAELPDAGSDAADAIAPEPAQPQRVDEVRVRGAREEVAPSVTMGRAEVRQLPGAFGDPFRAIDALPGVTPVVSGLPFFYVRGAPPGNVGYFIDGVRVPYLFHVGAGPSVIHPGLVDRVDLYSGGYPARFGRFAGGIVAGETTAPKPELHGEGNIRLFDLGALVETGYAGGRGTALLAGRYSYTAAILSLIAKDTTLDYRDYEARVSYDLTPRDRISLFSFGSFDFLSQFENNIENVLFASEFYRLDTRYDHTFGPRTKIRTAVTLGFDQTRIPDQPRNSRDTMGAVRVELAHAASDDVQLRGGMDVTLEAYRADVRPYSDPDDPSTKRFNALFPPRDDVTMGAWADVVLKLDRWEMTPGLRLDLYRSGGASALGVDPRIATRFEITRDVHVIHAFGLAHQPPSFVIPIPGLMIGQLRGGLQQSIQSSAGVELDLPDGMTATITAFDNIFQNMSDTLGVTQQRNAAESALVEQRSLGSAKGLELYLRRRLTRRIGGYVSYTFSRSTRSVGSETFLSAFDRTHVANVAAAYDLGRNWRFGARFTFYTGTPVIPRGGGGLTPPPRSLEPDRDPVFYRLDLRVEKRWNLSKTVWLAFVAEMMNVTLHKETVKSQEIGPVSIPSLGVEGAF